MKLSRRRCATEGNPIGILGIAGISPGDGGEEALRKSEAELQVHRQLLQRMVDERTHDLERATGRLEQTQFAMDRVGIGIHWVGEDGRLLYVNPGCCGYGGLLGR